MYIEPKRQQNRKSFEKKEVSSVHAAYLLIHIFLIALFPLKRKLANTNSYVQYFDLFYIHINTNKRKVPKKIQKGGKSS